MSMTLSCRPIDFISFVSRALTTCSPLLLLLLVWPGTSVLLCPEPQAIDCPIGNAIFSK